MAGWLAGGSMELHREGYDPTMMSVRACYLDVEAVEGRAGDADAT